MALPASQAETSVQDSKNCAIPSTAAAAEDLPADVAPPEPPSIKAAEAPDTNAPEQADTPAASTSELAVPSQIDVICADTKGVLMLDFDKMRCFILYKGQEMSGTDFERAAGREKAKKWKTSVRLLPEGGKQGEMIGEYLQRNGLDVRMSQLFKLGEARPVTVRAPAASRPPPNSTAVLATSVAETEIMDHLEKQYIGLQQGDPDATFDTLPKGDARPALSPGTRFIDLRKASYEELMQLAAASATNPFGELLRRNPGVLPSRLGYMTGQQPKRQRLVTSAPDVPRAQQLMAQYLAGALPGPPWEAMGLSKAPVIGGQELDLRKLYEAVQQSGGFDSAVLNKRFGRIASKLAIDITSATNAAYLLKSHYQRLIAPYLGPQAVADTQPALPATAVQQDGNQIVSSAEAPSSSDAGDDVPMTAEDSQAADGTAQQALLQDSTMQQHNAVLSARLQNQPDSSAALSIEDDIAALPDITSTFKSTLVDSNGPIPGL